MGWEVNDEEFESVLALPANRRYDYLVKRAASHGELWGLRGEGGWVVSEDDEGNQHFPVWPHQRFAQALAEGLWEGEKPVSIDIDEWVDAWLPNLERDGMRVAVFQTPDDKGVGVSPERLKTDLEAELEQFSL
jgi:Protein of unknown function (DUF2750)